MKQTIVMILLLTVGTVGALTHGPFVGVSIYYLFAVLRPQYLWEWALPEFAWSYYVGIATIAATYLYLPVSSRGKISHSAYIALAFSGWITLSHVFALNHDVSSRWYWEYLKIFTMFFCASIVITRFSQVRVLYVITVLAIGYIAYEVNSLYLFDRRMDIYFSGFGGLDNNGAGLMLAMGVPMAYFLWQAYTPWWRWLFLALVPVMLHGVLLSFSRGAMIALLLASPLLILRSTRKKGMILFFIGLISVLPILAGTEIRTRFFSIEQYQEDKTAQSRFDSWTAAWNIALDNPIVGVGIRNADLFSYKYGADTVGRTIHSQYLQIAADSGLPALGLYLMLLYAAWRSTRRTQKHCRDSFSEGNEDRHLPYSIASGIESALAVFCIGSTFLSLEIFELPYLVILLALKIPLTLGQEESEAVAPVPSPAFVEAVTS